MGAKSDAKKACAVSRQENAAPAGRSVFVMICLIDKERLNAFLPLIPSPLYPLMKRETVFLVGAVEHGVAVGAAVFELGENQADLLSIAVAPQCRRRSVGSAMLRRCVTLLQSTSVRAFTAMAPEGEKELDAFFSSLSWFRPVEPASCIEIPVRKLGKLPLLCGPAPGVIPLEGIPGPVYQEYLQRAFPESEVPCRRETLDQRVSQVILQNGKIAACALFASEEDGIELSWLQNMSTDKMAVLLLLRAAAAEIQKFYSPDTSVLFSVDLPLTARLSEKILAGEGNRKCVKVWEISDFDLMLFEEDAAASRREESAE